MIAAPDLLALGAAACWAVSALLSADPAKQLGAFAFVRWRMGLVLLLLWPAAWLASGAALPDARAVAWMVVSGIVGITLGDSALFAAMNALGPRRSGVLFATQALFGAALGFVLLDERLGAQAYLAALVTVAGVMTAIAWGRRSSEVHAWEPAGNSSRGVALGLAAAAAQALGMVLAKPALSGDDAVDPVLALALRVSAAWATLWLLRLLHPSAHRARAPVNLALLRQTAFSGWVGMGLGMGLLLWALHLGSVGVVGVLSSVTPILVLPLLWCKFGRIPPWGAWLGACLAFVGTALMVTR